MTPHAALCTDRRVVRTFVHEEKGRYRRMAVAIEVGRLEKSQAGSAAGSPGAHEGPSPSPPAT